MVNRNQETKMSKNTSVVLGKEHDKFIRSQIKNGRFTSVSEAMRAGLRLLEEQELKIQALRAAIIAGEKSGAATDFNMNDYIALKRRVA
jgi:antitoxin ParD1/3/4